MHSVLISLSLIALSYATPLSTNPYNVPRQRSLTKAPILNHFHPHGTINDSYIVMFKPGLATSLKDNHFNFLQMAHASDPLVSIDGLASGVRHVYDHIDGYAGHFTQGVLEQIRTMPEIEYIERDQVVKIVDTQKGAPWGLARISHRKRLTFATFTKYLYEPTGGDGVDVYVIDTGININHVEFQGRASWGATIPAGEVDDDDNGHGTHCAGTIASRKWGVAKQANVIAVKVLGANGSGSLIDVIKGVDWAVSAATKKAEEAKAEYAATGKTKHKGSVSNMSLGAGASESMDRAVNTAVERGLHFAVAAGNDNADACKYSPARAEKAVTVGASTLADQRAYFSNWGKCVDVFAPGLNIVSAYIGSPQASATLSGTSMASPHTAGMLAYLLSLYPSKIFNPRPRAGGLIPLPILDQQRPLTTRVASLYSFAREVLPSWMSDFLPSTKALEMATVPVPTPPTLTPEELKRALIALATQDLLVDLPNQTPNLLIFNNATDDA